jgi:hypothetical protein
LKEPDVINLLRRSDLFEGDEWRVWRIWKEFQDAIPKANSQLDREINSDNLQAIKQAIKPPRQMPPYRNRIVRSILLWIKDLVFEIGKGTTIKRKKIKRRE